jgi:adenine-specific DNA glycosylase
MDLEAAFEKNQSPRGKICPVQVIMDSLDEKNRQALKKAIDSNLAAYVISKTVRAEGMKLAEMTIRAHRKGECKCATK